MANPQVRPHLSFYPEEKSDNLSEARQFSQWLYEVPDEQVGPMLRIGMMDYYTFEPVMLTTGDICMPHRWYMHGGRYYAHCWKMVMIRSGGQRFWRVIMGHGGFTVEQNQFLKNFPQLVEDAALYPNLVDVRKIRGKEAYGLPKICISHVFKTALICQNQTRLLLNGNSPILQWVTPGVNVPLVLNASPFQSGCIAMIHLAMSPSDGTNITAFSLQLLVFHALNLQKSTTFTF